MITRNLRLIFYYTDLFCEKVDLHTDAFIERIEALKLGDTEKVEFIEKIMLEPLEQQITFLVDKLYKLSSQKEEQDGQYRYE